MLSSGEKPGRAAPAQPRPSGPPREGGASAAAFCAIVLAGGRASRLGGADKPGLVFGAHTLLGSVISAAMSAGASQVIVVGPDRPELRPDASPATHGGPAGGIKFVLEEPPGSGPVPALRRGLAEVSAPVVAVLAADLPFLRARQLEGLLDAVAASAGAERPVTPGVVAAETARPDAGRPGLPRSGAILLDDAGRPQWLVGCWRTEVLRAAVRAHDGGSLRGLLGPLDPALLRYDLAAGEPPPWLDCDTADDLRLARAWRDREVSPPR